MTIQETMQQLQHASLKERIQIIELLLQSLKDDIYPQNEAAQEAPKAFFVQTFNLGQDIQVDRGEMYAERGI
jgi:hypothetical protein